MRYNIGIVAELSTFRPLPFTLTLDGVTIERDAMLVAVGNGSSYGGGIRLCEGALLDDGLLDVVIIQPAQQAQIAAGLPQALSGHAHDDSRIRTSFGARGDDLISGHRGVRQW